MTRDRGDLDPSTICEDGNHEWQQNGIVGRDESHLIVEYVCSNPDCSASFTEREPINGNPFLWSDLD